MQEEVREVAYKNALEMLAKMGAGEEPRGFSFRFEESNFANRIENKEANYKNEVDSISLVEGVKKQTAPLSLKDMVIFKQGNEPVQGFVPGGEAEATDRQKVDVPGVGKRTSWPVGSAALDIKGMVDKLGKGIGMVDEKFRKSIRMGVQGNTVMDKLSPQDQISDLEKISLGLDQGAFDQEQLKVIREEVAGLNVVARKQDLAKLEEVQRSLLMLRNRRLQDVVNKLAINN